MRKISGQVSRQLLRQPIRVEIERQAPRGLCAAIDFHAVRHEAIDDRSVVRIVTDRPAINEDVRRRSAQGRLRLFNAVMGSKTKSRSIVFFLGLFCRLKSAVCGVQCIDMLPAG